MKYIMLLKVVALLLTSSCATVEIKTIDCNVNQNWPSCRVVAEEVPV